MMQVEAHVCEPLVQAAKEHDVDLHIWTRITHIHEGKGVKKAVHCVPFVWCQDHGADAGINVGLLPWSEYAADMCSQQHEPVHKTFVHILCRSDAQLSDTVRELLASKGRSLCEDVLRPHLEAQPSGKRPAEAALDDEPAAKVTVR